MADRGWETIPGEGNEDPVEDGIVSRAREMVDAYVEALVAKAQDAGYTVDEISRRLADRGDLLDPVVDAFYASLQEREPGFVAETHDYHQGFARRLRGYYGAALDGFLAFINVCVESATGADSRGTGSVDATGQILFDLHARGCLVAHEVHALLSNGYPSGALAAWRTVHELQVIAAVLADHGRENDSDLAKRWEAGDAVIRFADAKVYQARIGTLGYEPLELELVASLKRKSEEAVATFPSINKGNDYGWAAEICKPHPPSFYRLEELAGRGHLRGHYRWASHRIHGDSRGNAYNWITRGGQSVRLAGPTNVGLLDPADLTMLSLWNLTNCILSSAREDPDPEPEEVVMMMTLERLYKRVSQAFVDANADVYAAEEALVKEEEIAGSPSQDDR